MFSYERGTPALCIFSFPLTLALFKSIWSYQFGEPGSILAAKVTDVYRDTRMATYWKRQLEGSDGGARVSSLAAVDKERTT